MTAGADTIYLMARAALDGIVAHWPAPNVHKPLPARQYVCVGTPAQDFGTLGAQSEQLTVSVTRTLGAAANIGRQAIIPEATDLYDNRAVRLVITVLRAVAGIQDEGMSNPVIPNAAQIDGEARTILGDAQCVLNALVAAHEGGTLAGFGNIAFETWDAVNPNGFVAGGAMTVRLGLW